MASRGRGRFGKTEDRNNLGRRNAPPSRYLWVGNLSNNVTEDILGHHFSQFGELERVALQIARNFAFIDFKHEEAAFAAMRALQGFVLAGSPIIVEFTKDNKSSNQHIVEDTPHIQVDESLLGKAFSPFGAIRKITTFSDRSYAFVCFENVSAASRAKMALEGKLFGNPRVQIRFAKRESGPSDRNIRNVPQFDEDFRGVKKMRMGSYGPEDELPEYSLPVPNKLKEWAWEGVIGKGGKRVCRARCFPVGKPMDMMLPAFIDCTARTSTEMLSKHYYQAPSSWVVFFVPQTDADIESYNDFMHYLEERQRVAVAKINENTSLFLVAPSEFSQNVLKVPGKLSISGVVLRLEPQNPAIEPTSGTGDSSFGSQFFHNYPTGNAGITELPRGSPAGPVSTLHPEQITSLASSVLGKRSAGQHGYSTGNQVIAERPQGSVNVPVPALQSEQLAQLASALSRGPTSLQAGLQQSSGQADDSDPGRRLQATLHLAATLLQNVQQRRP